MNDQQKNEAVFWSARSRDVSVRHWISALGGVRYANDFETEHLYIYHEDAVLEYPQSGERTRGRRNIQNQRASQPIAKKRFTVRANHWRAVIFGSPSGQIHPDI